MRVVCSCCLRVCGLFCECLRAFSVHRLLVLFVGCCVLVVCVIVGCRCCLWLVCVLLFFCLLSVVVVYCMSFDMVVWLCVAVVRCLLIVGCCLVG